MPSARRSARQLQPTSRATRSMPTGTRRRARARPSRRSRPRRRPRRPSRSTRRSATAPATSARRLDAQERRSRSAPVPDLAMSHAAATECVDWSEARMREKVRRLEMQWCTRREECTG
jgi:hypothetical protein